MWNPLASMHMEKLQAMPMAWPKRFFANKKPAIADGVLF